MTMSRVAQFRAEHLLKIRGEDFGIDRAVDQKGRRDIFGPQRGNEGGTLPVTVGHGPDTAPPLRTTPFEPEIGRAHV